MINAKSRDVIFGEFAGLLKAFEWFNTKCDHGCTFEIVELPESSTIHQSVVTHFGKHATSVELVRIENWESELDRVLNYWFFQYMDQLKASASCMLAASFWQQVILKIVAEKFNAALLPQTVWNVNVVADGFYECYWNDFAIDGDAGRYLLHFGVSD